MNKPLVVLADDEAHITCVVAQKLRAAGFSVATARDGEEAFELVTRLRPVLVITDLQMPRLSGLDLALKLAKTGTTSHIPIMMLTARGYILDQTVADQTNIKHVIGKPFSVRDVVRRATELVGSPDQEADARTEAA